MESEKDELTRLKEWQNLMEEYNNFFYADDGIFTVSLFDKELKQYNLDFEYIKNLIKKLKEFEEKYGEFDLGEIKEGEKGRVAYYIYTDNGPIMPDHLKHYYYMEYDEWGMIYNVFDGLQSGG